MLLNEGCVACLLRRKLDNYPAGAEPGAVAEYRRRVRAVIENGRGFSSPEVNADISAIYREIFGPERDYTDVKRRFNALMLALEPSIQADVDAAPDPLMRAVEYAMVGNYIDFAALGDIDEGELRRRLGAVDAMAVDPAALEALRGAAVSARRLALFTDNCGEIVADKVLLRTLRRLNPALDVTVIVRGAPVVNDATVEDAEQVGMGAVAHRVLGSGCDLPGAVLTRISAKALAEVDAADLIVSKGQANYEGLSGCGRNIFYIFMCKCELFINRFNVPRFSGVLTKEGKY